MNVLIADKGYNANYLIEKAESIDVKTVIPPRSMRKNPRMYDKNLYKHRNLIERMFNNMKQFRQDMISLMQVIFHSYYFQEFACG